MTSGFKIFLGTSLLFFVDVALAASGNCSGGNHKNIGFVAGSLNSNTDEFIRLFKGGSLIGGTGFAISSALKFKEHNENPNQVKLSQPITRALVGGVLLSLGTWMDVLSGTAMDENFNVNGSREMFETAIDDPCFS